MNYQNTKTIKKGSVRNVILIFIAILLVGGAFVFAEYRNQKTPETYVANEISVMNDKLDSGIDTDGDGLKDWEEILVGSDPRDAKSKGDISSKASEIKDAGDKKEPLTSTELLSRDFFARYMELRKMGISGDKQSQEDAMNQSVISVIGTMQAKSYSISNIIIDSDTSTNAIKSYGDKVNTILNKYAVKSRNEGIIAKDAVDKQDMKILNELDPIIASYKNMLNELLKTKVPNTISQLHLDLINSLSGLIFVAESFKKIEKDPVAGIQGAGNYLKYAEAFNNSYNGIKSYLNFVGVNPIKS